MRIFAGAFLLFFGTSGALAQTVVIDPGHGGRDPGGVGCGLQEEDIVLDVSLQAAAMLREAGLTVHLTRTDDRFIELAARSTFANSRGASRFVSVHSNANEGTPATGTETFVYTSATSASRTLGQEVQDELISTWGLRNRGLKSANFSVLRRTSMPAALAELAFINRCDPDARLLGSASERRRIAAAIARGVLASLGRSGPVDPPPVTPPPPVEPTGGRIVGVSFEDVGVGLEDTTRRISGATVRVDGTTLTSDGNGAFAFALSAGTYTVEVSKAGYTTGTRECVVTTGDTWCSVGIRPAAAPMTRVRGVVYENTGAGLTDSAARLAGATVQAGGTRVVTDAGGNFTFEAEAGSLTLNVSRDGYAPSVRACTVSGAETWCSVGLVPNARAGAMQGVLFVRGALSNRIVGATVRVRETGATVQSAGGSGYWRFEAPAGTYNLDVEATGYQAESRTCTVTEGGEAWCSMGLTRSGSGGGFVVDNRAPEEAALDPREPEELSSGCSASGTGDSSGMWLVLVGLLCIRRRRHLGTVAAMAALLTFGTACSEEPVAASSTALTQEEVPRGGELMLAQEVGSFAHLESPREITQGDFIDLELSPDGQHLALSHARYLGLSLLSLSSGELRTIHEGAQAGYEPRWRADGQAIGVRTQGQTSTAAPTLAFDLGAEEVAPFQPAAALSVRVDDDAVIMRTPDGDESRLAPAGDSYFEPRASADGAFVVFRGLSTGLYVHRRADGTTFMVGPGAHARFSPGSDQMVFERSEDDGHERIRSTLYVMDLRHDELRYGPVETDAVRPASPSVAAGMLAFMDEGSAIVAELKTN